MKKALIIALILLVPVGLLMSCAAGPARSETPGPDWSRGVQIGATSINGAIALYSEPDGQRVHLAWPSLIDDSESIEYVQLDAKGSVVLKHSLPLAVHSPREVRIIPDGQGGLLLCYLNGISDSRRVVTCRLDANGEVVGEAQAVTGEDLGVDDYAVVPSAAGVDLFWSNNGQGTSGLYHVQLDANGQVVQPGKLIYPAGISPSVQVDRNGGVHVAWIYEPAYFEEHVYYATFDSTTRELVAPTELGYFALSPKAASFGPELALSESGAYVVWSWELLSATQTGSAGEGECRYVSFPLDEPTAAKPKLLAMPAALRPDYQPAEGVYDYTELAGLGGGASGLVYMPSAVQGQHDEAALAVAYQVATRTSSRVLAGVVYLGDDGPKGYQVAGRSARNVMRPVLSADANGQLHIAWIELAGFHNYEVYYASTTEPARAALGRFGRDDVINGAYGVAWSLVQAISMFPIGFVWLVIPFFWVMLYYIIKVEGDLERLGPRIALGVAIATYLFCKYLLMPVNFIGAAPLVNRLSPAVADVYMVSLPVAILAVAAGALVLYLKRAESRTLLFAYLIFGVTDTLVTFLIYAPGILGE